MFKFRFQQLPARNKSFKSFISATTSPTHVEKKLNSHNTSYCIPRLQSFPPHVAALDFVVVIVDSDNRA